MAAAMNGIALHRGLVPYGGTFLVFSDYARPAIRLAALMRLRVIHVMTHDSIGLGEDGPTHQPVEHLASLRAIPNLLVFRPADAVETAEAWECALAAAGTAVDPVPVAAGPGVRCRERSEPPADVRLGAYVLREPAGGRDVTLIATGSEVGVAVAASDRLAADGIRAAVVSAPCWELFRRTIRGLPPRRAGRGTARRRRGGHRGRLGALAWRARRLRRHEGIRRIGARRDAVREIRHHARRRGARRPAAHRTVRETGSWPASRCASCWTTPPSMRTACRPSTSTTWNRCWRSSAQPTPRMRR